MTTDELLLATLTKRRTELQEQRQVFVLQAERQLAFLEGQVAEINKLIKALEQPVESGTA